MPTVIAGPRCNRRVTCDPSPSNARSESSIAVNPLDPYNLVASSKRFTNPMIYGFSLAAYASFDGGQSWSNTTLPLLPGWAGSTDPAVAWDNVGHAYVVALPFGPGTATDFVGPVIGIAIYKSIDGGRTWGSPTVIHTSSGDDKQMAAGDWNVGSPHYGNVYAVWDNGSQLAFARTTDHGTTWKGVGTQPVGTSLASDSFAPELSVAADGTVYIVWIAGSQIKFVRSTDGGDSFSSSTSPSAIAASGISPIASPPLPSAGGWPTFPGATFRVLTIPTGCTGSGNRVIFAWADIREGVSRIYYRRSNNGGSSWQGAASGEPLLTGAVGSAANQHDFHPQIVSTPDGEIGCGFYEYGPRGLGGTAPYLMDVVLAVSTNNGTSFPNRVVVNDQSWDPAVDAPFSHGNPATTFIGDYFGLDASRLGFFPCWTDTRTGVQEIYSARVSVDPADLYIRDTSGDVGALPSPGFHWEYVDLIVRRQPDGDVNFVNEDLLRDGVTDHYVYGRVHNNGPNDGRNVKLAVVVGNYPSLQALPGAEFRYPQDWYPGDWDTPALQARHLYLGESAATTVNNGATKILGPVLWPAAQIPPAATWHPCLLAEVRADNNDSAGGAAGCELDADPDPCVFGSYFWGNNNVCQRNLSYATVPAGVALPIELPFLIGSPWSTMKYVEVILDKGRELALTPMTLTVERIPVPGEVPIEIHEPAELVLVGGGKVTVRMGESDAGEFLAAPGTAWISRSPLAEVEPETCFGGQKVGRGWQLTHPRASVGFPIHPGELRRMSLSFVTPEHLKPGSRPLIRVFQRNDRQTVAGGVILELHVTKGKPEGGHVGEPESLQQEAGERNRPIARRPRASARTKPSK
jgi:hypothetical protein